MASPRGSSRWNVDGSEFAELNFGGAGKILDGFGGAAGDSQTGGHHIMAVAESMVRASMRASSESSVG